MIANIDVLLDSGSLGIIPGGSLPDGEFPLLTRSDVYNLRLLIKELNQSNTYIDSDMTGGSFKFAIGEIDEAPQSGQFKLVVNGVTSSAITFSSSATSLAQSIYSAISNNVSTISLFGVDESSFVCVATSTNTALTISGDAFTLYPSSSIIVGNRVEPSANDKAQKVLKLRRNPAVYADNFVDVVDGSAIDLVKVVDGNPSAFQNETYRIDVGTSVLGGSFVLNYGGNSTTAIPIFSSASTVQGALNSIGGLTNNIDVSSNNNAGYSISFVRGLGQTNIVTPLAIDISGVFLRKYKQATVTLSTVELDELFAVDGSDTLTTVAEIQYLDGGSPKTLFQGDVTIRRDLILDNTSLPVNTASYYTKAQADAIFVEESITGAAGTINANNFSLHSSDGKKSIDWNARKLFDGSVEYLRWDDGIGFFGNQAISKPSGNNFINLVTRTGLLDYTTPTGTNLVNSITKTGLIEYTAPSSTNLINCLTSSGIINYTVPTTSNLVAAITATGILNYVAPTGTNIVCALTNAGLINYTAPAFGTTLLNQLSQSGIISGYNVPSTTNFINALTQTGLFNYTPSLPKNTIARCVEEFGTINTVTNIPYSGLTGNAVVASQIGLFPGTRGANAVSFTLDMNSLLGGLTVSSYSSYSYLLPLNLSTNFEQNNVTSPSAIPGIAGYQDSLTPLDILEVYPTTKIAGLVFNASVTTFNYLYNFIADISGPPEYIPFPVGASVGEARGTQLTIANITDSDITVPASLSFKLLHVAF